MQPSPINFKGLDRSVIPYRADKATFYELTNLRHRDGNFGTLEQTPYLRSFTHARGTYWDGASQTEPANSGVVMMNELIMTQYVLRVSAGNQIPVFYQSVNTATATVQTGCRLVINNLTALAITLGNTLQVEMTGAATFRWRKNGGAASCTLFSQ